ncbi:insulinase family protein [Hymenobacter busanensis]|uniref:Insulinase family protein n=1 Tax=Hymenobacter busanensis TaxID=2607656 RepID=A0A7L4ZXH4_9BACT|nr:pitrilysin family protein [Hymenobacter busanensis]KAA9325270.1 insulinase family protein [Hymenobacter busanensis]QHJ07737.1 insulinase family protein [Hymenobacter busanensis]
MLNRVIAPPSRPVEQVALPTAEVTRLSNGARLHVLANTAQPVIRLQVVFPAGRWYDPTPGVSLLTARALLEGTTTRTARQIADEVAFYGASLDCEQGFDRSTLTLYCLSKYLPQLLPLVQDVLLNATFPEAELELIKTRTIQNIRVERQKTSYLAAERLSRNLFGPEHPYGISFDEQAFALLSAKAVQDFYRHNYSLSQAEVFLCGDVEESHISSLSKLLGETVAEQQPRSIPAVAPVTQQATDYVTVKESLQATLRLGRLSPPPSHPDYHALQVLVKVLGGYFGSRLMKNIREDKGLTYGIYASIAPREHATNIVIGSDVNAANASAAIHEINVELARLQNELIPDEELETVRNYTTGKFLNELGTVFEQCDKYKTLILFNLPLNFYSHYLSTVNSIEPKALQELAKHYLSTNELIEVVAGPTTVLT